MSSRSCDSAAEEREEEGGAAGVRGGIGMLLCVLRCQRLGSGCVARLFMLVSRR